MSKPLCKTKTAIMNAAGPLFAEYGCEGLSIRTIAEIANVNTAAINYHFGSKENLYTETVTQVIGKCKDDLPPSFSERVAITDDRQELISLLIEAIEAKVESHLLNINTMECWNRRLIIRILLDEDKLKNEVVEINRMGHDAWIVLLKKLNPSLSDTQCCILAFAVSGHVAFYIFAKSALLKFAHREEFDTAYCDEVKHIVYQTLCTPLNLPVLEGSDGKA